MKPKPLLTKFHSRAGQSLVAILCVLSLAPGKIALHAQQPAALPEQAAPKIPDNQLDSLVAPIALYPDPLLSQVLVASTYPLEIIQLQQWLEKHKDLKGDALVAAVKKENWDPSIQGMAALPDAVKQLAENIKWTTDLGNAFLAQQSDVMDAVQRMRMKAKDAGKLKSNAQLKVETKVVETKTVVVIEPANPQIVYVPSYNPVVVYGPPVYPYPPIYYPPATGAVLAFGAGIAIGAAWGNGGWGYNCGWGSNNSVTINNNNTFVNNANKANISNRPSTLPAGGSGNWQHNPQHRGGAPYANKQTANQYGGTARGDSLSTRQANAQHTARDARSNPQQPGASNRSAMAANRPASNVGSNAGASASNMGLNRSSGGGNNIGNRQVSGNDFSRNASAFGGASNRASAQASSARGASSMGGSRGGGGARSGGGGRRR
jgi:uncharacterized protein DUF3300